MSRSMAMTVVRCREAWLFLILTLGILIILTISQSTVLADDCSLISERLESLFPLEDEIPSWVFLWERQCAVTDAGLYEIIDGAAPVYLAHGFVEAAFQWYEGDAGGPATLLLSPFNQGTPEGAEGLYHDPGSGSGTPWEGDNPGEEARIEEALFSYTIEFWDEEFFVRIYIEPKSPDTLQAGKDFAWFVADRIEGGTPTEGTSWGTVKALFR